MHLTTPKMHLAENHISKQKLWIYSKSMKRTALKIIFTILFLSILAAEEISKITISRIRVFLDDTELPAEITDDADDNISAAISRETILSFTKLKAGKEISTKVLEKEVEQTTLRLMNSGYFYNATVEIVPPRKNPDKRTIIINVTTGFLNRYGGNYLYGIFGKVALNGNRNQLLGIAGWNANGFSYTDENLFNKHLITEASIITDVPEKLFSNKNGINFNGSFSFGYFFNPDLRICVDTIELVNTKYGFISESFIFSPYIYSNNFITNKLVHNGEFRFYYKPFVSLNDFSGEICQSFNYSPTSKLNLAALICGGCRFGKNPDFNEAFNHDLSLEHYAVSNKSGLGKRAIRSGYNQQDLFLQNYVMASFEARWKAADFYIAHIFPGNVKPFIFTDLAFGTAAKESEWNFLDAYGAGVQINFDCPVFAYFNFAYGVNHFGNGKFCFYTGLSF